jgi:hypothetical protein
VADFAVELTAVCLRCGRVFACEAERERHARETGHANKVPSSAWVRDGRGGGGRRDHLPPTEQRTFRCMKSLRFLCLAPNPLAKV